MSSTTHRIRTGWALVVLSVVAAGYGASPASGQSGYRSSSAPATRYYQDSNGDWHGQTVEGDDWHSGARYADCSPMSSCEGHYDPIQMCNTCHSSTQTRDRAYVSQFDLRRHVTVHFPGLWLSLQPGQRISWGPYTTLTVKGTQIIATRSRDGRDMAAFPPGTRLLRNRRGALAMLVLPAAGFPKNLLR